MGRGGPSIWGPRAAQPARGCRSSRDANKCSRALPFDVRRLNIMSSEQWKPD